MYFIFGSIVVQDGFFAAFVMPHDESTHSTPRSEARGMPFDRLKAPSTAEGLRVDTALR
jgi:hypothetical protein